MIERICEACGKKYMALKNKKLKTCSRSCARILNWSDPTYRQMMVNAHKGKTSAMKGKKHRNDSIIKMRHSHYSGKEKIISTNGYVYVYCPDHPRAINGRVPEQVLIAEKVLGEYLKKNEVVHHINLNKKDNRNENLLICTKKYHKEIHAKINGFGTVIQSKPKRNVITGRFIKEDLCQKK